MILDKKTPDAVLTFKGESILVQIDRFCGNGISFRFDDRHFVLVDSGSKIQRTFWCVAGTMQPVTIVLDGIKGEFSLRIVPRSCDIIMEPLDFVRVQ